MTSAPGAAQPDVMTMSPAVLPRANGNEPDQLLCRMLELATARQWEELELLADPKVLAPLFGTQAEQDEAMLEMVRAATDWFIMSNTTA